MRYKIFFKQLVRFELCRISSRRFQQFADLRSELFHKRDTSDAMCSLNLNRVIVKITSSGADTVVVAKWMNEGKITSLNAAVCFFLRYNDVMECAFRFLWYIYQWPELTPLFYSTLCYSTLFSNHHTVLQSYIINFPCFLFNHLDFFLPLFCQIEVTAVCSCGSILWSNIPRCDHQLSKSTGFRICVSDSK